MNEKYTLEQIREVWLNAYFNGETDWLAYLEAHLFFVTRNGELISKSEQIEFIERSRAKFPSKRANIVEFGETVAEMKKQDHWATVSGSAWIKRNGEIVSQCDFFELWLMVENRWQIATLCIEDIDRTQKAQR
ncbi:hypothetical protein WL71_05235 [Burkholderia ubonensis]|uniref:DUF4440 domain-containing protein n=1 Tax=Burkholderia ubonensis TaxID=101571 RepID=A0A107FFI8_9BURK|nr:hypothetical protein [Burkholderia ubonensis]AOK63131.1 hypothetical protein WM29_29400 [Burkholderia ubonensis]KWD91029.1 hypothetical protein WL70_03450 [Burkholderia ubonensis]KWD91673.1 hypothetical protein WL71_05235 [Burkholderia ubonensis]KWD92553.1 hypothetical protein WL72_29210 [Burkholderia ubonensis]KWE03347.1 hypothetical protein WL73_14785 [Burkholderia ubonensis]